LWLKATIIATGTRFLEFFGFEFARDDRMKRRTETWIDDLESKGQQTMALNERFRKASVGAANFLGSPWVFLANVLLILVWLAFGPVFHFSDTWQLLVNTATTVITYLAVFLIQNTQNRDARAVHLKLDELISSIDGARNRLIDLEDLTDDELNLIQKQFQRLKRLTNKGGPEATSAVKGEPEKLVNGDG
jgi:low affinity Fe/Cu permease